MALVEYNFDFSSEYCLNNIIIIVYYELLSIVQFNYSPLVVMYSFYPTSKFVIIWSSVADSEIQIA